jgi:hypothetical protein
MLDSGNPPDDWPPDDWDALMGAANAEAPVERLADVVERLGQI